ncbi:hypothetical protein AO467_07090 [Oenococcus oeni]|nr:hypothetical protein [Oenococcus oeni]PDH93349.1 hypothetical protein AO467_07090 [Oenococcus oeni]
MCPKEIVTYSLGHMNKRRVLIEHLSVVYLRYKYKKAQNRTRTPGFSISILSPDINTKKQVLQDRQGLQHPWRFLTKSMFFKRKRLFFFEKTVYLVF